MIVYFQDIKNIEEDRVIQAALEISVSHRNLSTLR